MRLAVRVQPRAKANAVVGWEGDALKVRLTAPPVAGKANKALVELLADLLGTSKSAVTVVSGRGAREKLVELEGLDEAQVQRRLGLPPGRQR